jgi:hypothetical protein
MNKTDAIFMAWRTYKTLTQGQKQSDFFVQKLKDRKIVTCVRLEDVFSEEEIEVIKLAVRPEKRMCFKNAHMLTYLFPDRVKYVEGEVTICGGGIGIEHAWNLVDGEHYVDLTFELALGEDVTKEGYVALGAYDAKTLRRVTHKTGYYGGIYNQLYLDALNKKAKRNKK